MLTLLVLLPLIGAGILSLLPEGKTAKLAGLVIGALTVVYATATLLLPILGGTNFQFAHRESYPWIPALGARWSLGVDGLSAWMCVVTALMVLAALVLSWKIEAKAKTFFALILALESFILGAFLATDLLLFFTFFELTLFPVFFLISGWGGARRKYAATKFFAYTFLGSILMLVGMIVLVYRASAVPSFELAVLQGYAANGQLWKDIPTVETLVFWCFAAALLVKTPAFPLHTWMPDAYAESPSAVPVLSGIMVKLGTFGMIRFLLPLFPNAATANAPILMTLGVLGIVYAGIVAVIQTDARRLLAYSSISHMGFILVGIASLTHAGLMGAGVQMVNHTIIAGALIVLVSFLIERRGTADLREFGGLKAKMPLFATLFLIALLGSVGLPGLSGFVGEFLALMGAFEAGHAGLYGMNIGFAAAAGLGVVLSAAYLLYLFQQIFYGKVEKAENAGLTDLSPREAGLAGVLALSIIVLGLQPGLVTKPIESATQAARLMATSPVDARPQWRQLGDSIAPNGDFVRDGKLMSPAALHPSTVARGE